MDDLASVVRIASKIPGWTRAREAEALAAYAYSLPRDAVVVEIGAFLGGGSVVLAGARKLRGSGIVHCVDPFDGSGDPVSTPHYSAIIMAFGGRPMLELFNENIQELVGTDRPAVPGRRSVTRRRARGLRRLVALAEARRNHRGA